MVTMQLKYLNFMIALSKPNVRANQPSLRGLVERFVNLNKINKKKERMSHERTSKDNA